MTDKKLETFKIGDHQKAAQRTAAKKEKAAEEEQDATLGFTRIEAILDQETPDSVAKSMSSLLHALADFESKSSTNRDKAAAQKAIVAVELTVDLMNFLYQTKTQLESGGDPG